MQPAVPRGLGMQTVGGALAWLSGAVAGIGAVFYAFGYIASIGYARMLGVEIGELRYDYTFYLQRGGRLFLSLIVETAPYVFCVLVVILGAMAVWQGLRSWLVNARIVQRLIQCGVNWRVVLYTGLFLFLALQLSTHLSYPEWMTVSGVLRGPADMEPAAKTLREWIVSDNGELLRNQFTYLALQHLWIGTLLLLAWRVCCAQRWGVLMMAPFGLVFLMSTVYLALDYGTLMLPTKFQKVEVSRHNETATMYFMNQLEERYGLWNPCAQKIEWISSTDREIKVIFREKKTIDHILKSAKELCSANMRSGAGDVSDNISRASSHE